MKDDIKLPPLPDNDAIEESVYAHTRYFIPLATYDAIRHMMQEYSIDAIKADRKRRGEPEGWQLVPKEPDDDQWGNLARDIIKAWDFGIKRPRELFKFLERSGTDIPQWLRDEPEMKDLDHTPSKGTRAVLIYKAMLAAAPKFGEEK